MVRLCVLVLLLFQSCTAIVTITGQNFEKSEDGTAVKIIQSLRFTPPAPTVKSWDETLRLRPSFEPDTFYDILMRVFSPIYQCETQDVAYIPQHCKQLMSVVTETDNFQKKFLERNIAEIITSLSNEFRSRNGITSGQTDRATYPGEQAVLLELLNATNTTGIFRRLLAATASQSFNSSAIDTQPSTAGSIDFCLTLLPSEFNNSLANNPYTCAIAACSLNLDASYPAEALALCRGNSTVNGTGLSSEFSLCVKQSLCRVSSQCGFPINRIVEALKVGGICTKRCATFKRKWKESPIAAYQYAKTHWPARTYNALLNVKLHQPLQDCVESVRTAVQSQVRVDEDSRMLQQIIAARALQQQASDQLQDATTEYQRNIGILENITAQRSDAIVLLNATIDSFTKINDDYKRLGGVIADEGPKIAQIITAQNAMMEANKQSINDVFARAAEIESSRVTEIRALQLIGSVLQYTMDVLNFQSPTTLEKAGFVSSAITSSAKALDELVNHQQLYSSIIRNLMITMKTNLQYGMVGFTKDAGVHPIDLAGSERYRVFSVASYSFLSSATEVTRRTRYVKCDTLQFSTGLFPATTKGHMEGLPGPDGCAPLSYNATLLDIDYDLLTCRCFVRVIDEVSNDTAVVDNFLFENDFALWNTTNLTEAARIHAFPDFEATAPGSSAWTITGVNNAWTRSQSLSQLSDICAFVSPFVNPGTNLTKMRMRITGSVSQPWLIHYNVSKRTRYCTPTIDYLGDWMIPDEDVSVGAALPFWTYATMTMHVDAFDVISQFQQLQAAGQAPSDVHYKTYALRYTIPRALNFSANADEVVNMEESSGLQMPFAPADISKQQSEAETTAYRSHVATVLTTSINGIVSSWVGQCRVIENVQTTVVKRNGNTTMTIKPVVKTVESQRTKFDILPYSTYRAGYWACDTDECPFRVTSLDPNSHMVVGTMGMGSGGTVLGSFSDTDIEQMDSGHFIFDIDSDYLSITPDMNLRKHGIGVMELVDTDETPGGISDPRSLGPVFQRPAVDYATMAAQTTGEFSPIEHSISLSLFTQSYETNTAPRPTLDPSYAPVWIDQKFDTRCIETHVAVNGRCREKEFFITEWTPEDPTVVRYYPRTFYTNAIIEFDLSLETNVSVGLNLTAIRVTPDPSSDSGRRQAGCPDIMDVLQQAVTYTTINIGYNSLPDNIDQVLTVMVEVTTCGSGGVGSANFNITPVAYSTNSTTLKGCAGQVANIYVVKVATPQTKQLCFTSSGGFVQQSVVDTVVEAQNIRTVVEQDRVALMILNLAFTIQTGEEFTNDAYTRAMDDAFADTLDNWQNDTEAIVLAKIVALDDLKQQTINNITIYQDEGNATKRALESINENLALFDNLNAQDNSAAIATVNESIARWGEVFELEADQRAGLQDLNANFTVLVNKTKKANFFFSSATSVDATNVGFMARLFRTKGYNSFVTGNDTETLNGLKAAKDAMVCDPKTSPLGFLTCPIRENVVAAAFILAGFIVIIGTFMHWCITLCNAARSPTSDNSLCWTGSNSACPNGATILRFNYVLIPTLLVLGPVLALFMSVF